MRYISCWNASRSRFPSGFLDLASLCAVDGWLTAAVAAVLVALLLLSNAGALANQFLALFRVQQFQPVSIDPQSFCTDLTSYLQNFGDMQGHYNSPPDIADPTQAQVKQYIDFPLLLPSHLPSGVGHVVHFYLLAQAGTRDT